MTICVYIYSSLAYIKEIKKKKASKICINIIYIISNRRKLLTKQTLINYKYYKKKKEKFDILNLFLCAIISYFKLNDPNYYYLLSFCYL